jgi:hypothetical protein
MSSFYSTYTINKFYISPWRDIVRSSVLALELLRLCNDRRPEVTVVSLDLSVDIYRESDGNAMVPVCPEFLKQTGMKRTHECGDIGPCVWSLDRDIHFYGTDRVAVTFVRPLDTATTCKFGAAGVSVWVDAFCIGTQLPFDEFQVDGFVSLVEFLGGSPPCRCTFEVPYGHWLGFGFGHGRMVWIGFFSLKYSYNPYFFFKNHFKVNYV